jgi:hypothetical protein
MQKNNSKKRPPEEIDPSVVLPGFQRWDFQEGDALIFSRIPIEVLLGHIFPYLSIVELFLLLTISKQTFFWVLEYLGRCFSRRFGHLPVSMDDLRWLLIEACLLKKDSYHCRTSGAISRWKADKIFGLSKNFLKGQGKNLPIPTLINIAQQKFHTVSQMEQFRHQNNEKRLKITIKRNRNTSMENFSQYYYMRLNTPTLKLDKLATSFSCLYSGYLSWRLPGPSDGTQQQRSKVEFFSSRDGGKRPLWPDVLEIIAYVEANKVFSQIKLKFEPVFEFIIEQNPLGGVDLPFQAFSCKLQQEDCVALVKIENRDQVMIVFPDGLLDENNQGVRIIRENNVPKQLNGFVITASFSTIDYKYF